MITCVNPLQVQVIINVIPHAVFMYYMMTKPLQYIKWAELATYMYVYIHATLALFSNSHLGMQQIKHIPFIFLSICHCVFT